MIIVRPLINVLGKIIKLPKDSYLDPTTLGSGTPTSSTVLLGDSTWGTVGSLGYVPYIGATQSVDLGNYGLYTDFVNFNLNPVASPAAGQIVYDGASGALSYLLNSSNVLSRIGQTMHAYVHNAEGSTITKGQAVYLYQASGNKASVKLAYNTTDGTSAKTFGLAAENIGANQNGMVICQGVLEGLNTGTYNPGDTLYLGATPGSYTAVKPYAPNHLVYIGIVERANNGNGQIYVKVQNGYELDEIHDVDLISTPPVNNNVLTYVTGTNNLWKPRSISSILGYTPQPTITLTTTGSSGASTFVSNTLNIPNYTLSGLGGVPTSRNITINGVTQDLSADRTYTIASSLTVGTTPISSGTVGRVLFEGSGNVVQEDGALFWDNTNKRLGVGISTPGVRLDIQGTTATDGGQLGAELLSSSGWTSTGWTGDYNVGFTHTVGNTSVLSNTLAAVVNNYYQIAYTITGRTAGSITIAFGGQSLASITATGTFGPQATTTGTLSITPTSDFDGTIVISIKQITVGTALINLRNSAGTATTEIRSVTSNANTFIGVNSGTRITTGLNNVAYGRSTLQQNTTGSSNNAFGVNALGLNTVGASNTAIGTSALFNNTSATNNTAVGNSALFANTTGTGNVAVGVSSLTANTTANNNTAIGTSTLSSNTTGASNTALGNSALLTNISGSLNVAIGANSLRNTTADNQVAVGTNALQNHTTGNNNTALGTNAGRFISGGSVNLTNSSNSVFIGNAAYPLADSQTNQIVIGDSAVGLGSNTVVLGNTSIVTTQLRGSVISGNQAALATNATSGFLYIPTCAGLPTGVPTAVTGKVPIVADTTNNKLYVYLGGAWTAMN